MAGDFKEGMRRLGLVLGVTGASLGIVVAVVVSVSEWSRYEERRRFTASLERSVVKELRSRIRLSASARSRSWSKGPEFLMYEPRTGKFETYLTPERYRTREEFVRFLDTVPAGYVLEKDEALTIPIPATFQQWFDEARPTELTITVNDGGVHKISVDGDGSISSVHMSNGGRTYQGSPPDATEGLIIVAAPILGFAIPWGACRLLTWLVSGFVGPSNDPSSGPPPISNE